jgi:hypothetical protein
MQSIKDIDPYDTCATIAMYAIGVCEKCFVNNVENKSEIKRSYAL